MHLHFTQSLEPLQGAGLGGSALGLHEGFRKTGVASVLLTTRDPTFDNTWEGVHQFVRKGPTKAFFAPKMEAEVKNVIRQTSVVHGHGFYVYPNFLIGRLTRQRQKPLVYHIQGFFDPWILARSKLKKRLAHWLFEDANFRHVAWWRAVSAKEASQAKAFGVTAPVEVLPNGVHLPPERSEDEVNRLVNLFPRKRPKRLVFLSRIHPKKGLDLLFGAWSGLDQDLVRNWEIAVFGPDEGGHRAEVEAIVQHLGLADTVSFHGSVFGETKEAAFRSGDCFVLPSRSEGFPMAVLEAASYGLPVMQTDECNFPELTAAGGAWEAKPSVDSLRQCLESALRASDQERRQRGEIGRSLVQRDYQWSAIAKSVDDLCQQYG
ncbi:MAG: glycosyltransferase [Puniceicoccaceae bacterium]